MGHLAHLWLVPFWFADRHPSSPLPLPPLSKKYWRGNGIQSYAWLCFDRSPAVVPVDPVVRGVAGIKFHCSIKGTDYASNITGALTRQSYSEIGSEGVNYVITTWLVNMTFCIIIRFPREIWWLTRALVRRISTKNEQAPRRKAQSHWTRIGRERFML